MLRVGLTRFDQRIPETRCEPHVDGYGIVA